MIYVHVPFCHRKCTYCAFYSRPAAGRHSVSLYVDGLLGEMERRRGEQGHEIQTVYFGGGTPSLLPLPELARIVEGLRRWFDVSHVQEATIEANPEDLTSDYLRGLAGLHFFNRLSIGVQSLDDGMLRLLNRRHTARQALDAVENAVAAGFHNISVDFIYGLPGLPAPAVHLPSCVTHVSAYALTVEPGTALAAQVGQGRVAVPGDDEVVRQYHAVRRWLAAEGFEQYEVSNYARPGHRSRHNSRYWDRTPYLGLGPAAHSFDGRRRQWNSPMDAESGTWSVENEELLTEADAYNELLMTALRTTDGLALGAVPEGHKERLHRAMQPYVDCGWIVFSAGRYVPTAEGLLHADGIAAALFV